MPAAVLPSCMAGRGKQPWLHRGAVAVAHGSAAVRDLTEDTDDETDLEPNPVHHLGASLSPRVTTSAAEITHARAECVKTGKVKKRKKVTSDSAPSGEGRVLVEIRGEEGDLQNVGVCSTETFARLMDDYQQACGDHRFLYDCGRIYEDQTPESLGMVCGDTYTIEAMKPLGVPNSGHLLSLYVRAPAGWGPVLDDETQQAAQPLGSIQGQYADCVQVRVHPTAVVEDVKKLVQRRIPIQLEHFFLYDPNLDTELEDSRLLFIAGDLFEYSIEDGGLLEAVWYGHDKDSLEDPGNLWLCIRPPRGHGLAFWIESPCDCTVLEVKKAIIDQQPDCLLEFDQEAAWTDSGLVPCSTDVMELSKVGPMLPRMGPNAPSKRVLKDGFTLTEHNIRDSEDSVPVLNLTIKVGPQCDPSDDVPSGKKKNGRMKLQHTGPGGISLQQCYSALSGEACRELKQSTDAKSAMAYLAAMRQQAVLLRRYAAVRHGPGHESSGTEDLVGDAAAALEGRMQLHRLQTTASQCKIPHMRRSICLI